MDHTVQWISCLSLVQQCVPRFFVESFGMSQWWSVPSSVRVTAVRAGRFSGTQAVLSRLVLSTGGYRVVLFVTADTSCTLLRFDDG